MEKSIPDIFQCPEHQAHFDRQGYVLINFLDQKDVRLLEGIFHELHCDLPLGRFMSDSYSSDQQLKKVASERITKIFLPYFNNYFKNFTPFGSSFLYKTKGEESKLDPHQDWTIVDETKAVALNVWVPLTDTYVHNGTLHVIPGSHHHILPLRAPTLPFFFSGHEELLKPYLIPLEVKAGQAVVLNQRLIHYSSPNVTEDVRIAITSGIKTSGAPMIFYYKDNSREDDILEYYIQDDDFLLSFRNFYEDIRQRPYLGMKGGEINYRLPQFSDVELKQLLDNMYISAGLQPPVNSKIQSGKWQRILRRLLGRKAANNE